MQLRTSHLWRPEERRGLGSCSGRGAVGRRRNQKEFEDQRKHLVGKRILPSDEADVTVEPSTEMVCYKPAQRGVRKSKERSQDLYRETSTR